MSSTVEAMTEEEFASWAESLQDAFLRCRDFGHRWGRLTARWDTQDRVYYRANRCADCHTTREQVLDYLGLILGTRYLYPEGYVAPAGVGRLDSNDRGMLRLTSIRRVLTDD